jgi:hypothetical protein
MQRKLIKQKSLPDYSERLLINIAATYSPAFLCSTMGHEGLNFSVRNGRLVPKPVAKFFISVF